MPYNVTSAEREVFDSPLYIKDRPLLVWGQGEKLIRDDGAANRIIILHDGMAIGREFRGPDGQPLTQVHFGPTVLGTESLTEGAGLFSSEITAHTQCLGQDLPLGDFVKEFSDNEDLRIATLRSISGQTRTVYESLAVATFGDAHERTVTTLLRLANLDGIVDRFSQGDLAEIIGITRPTVNGVLNRLQRLRQVDLPKTRHIVIENAHALGRKVDGILPSARRLVSRIRTRE